MERPNKWRQTFHKEREAIEAECLRRLETGRDVYREMDVTTRIENLMGRDLITDLIEELLDQRNYIDMEIIKLKILDRAMEHNSDVQKVLPSGKAKVAIEIGGATCTLDA